MKVQNSLQGYIQAEHLSLLILVPHQDDEINLAGSVIHLWRQAGCQVTVVFMANGDSVAGISPEIRIHEALDSLQVLGVSQENVIFLGYGECLHERHADLYTTGRDEPITSLAGHKETYGVRGSFEYRWGKSGCHSPYTYPALVSDIRDCLLDVLADVVMVVDWDVHHDHRLLSVAFEEAMGQILVRRENSYRPQVYKGFAYGTAYYAPADFYQVNLASTRRPRSAPEYGSVFEMHNPIYRWEDRVRFPVPQDCLRKSLPDNIQYIALQQHASQHAAEHAEKIINADKVFWQRRTDSLMYQAICTASSGDTKPLNDFLIIYPKDIFAIETDFRSHVWRPVENDLERKIRCTFKEPQTLERVVFYTEVKASSGLQQVTLTLSNGWTRSVCSIHPLGRENVIDIPAQKNIDWFELRLDKYEGEMPGLTELEAFADREPVRLPILKIMVDNEFAYMWQLRVGSSVQLEAYEAIPGRTVWHLVRGNSCRLRGSSLETGKNFDEAIVRCQDRVTGAFDQILIRGVSAAELRQQKKYLLLERFSRGCRQFKQFPCRFVRQCVKRTCKRIGIYTFLKKIKRNIQ